MNGRYHFLGLLKSPRVSNQILIRQHLILLLNLNPYLLNSLNMLLDLVSQIYSVQAHTYTKFRFAEVAVSDSVL